MMVYRMIPCALITILVLFDFAVADIAPNYTFMHEATEAPRFSFYDYIIVGGGTAGIPLAITLSEKYSVLLLERGKSPYGDNNISRIENWGRYFFDTSPNSPAQNFEVEGVPNTRPRVLGGGTSINIGFWSRGEEQYNIEAKLTDPELILESYQWAEEKIIYEPVVGPWQVALGAGLLEAGVQPDNGYTFDHLIGTKVGGTMFDPNGTRHSAADLLQYANPDKLKLYIFATVNKVLFQTRGRSSPKANGVVFEDTLGKKHVAYLKSGAHNEIILCAGALGSPQLLMLSGIGPKDQLDALNIPIVLEQPLVGKEMADNPLTAIFVPSPIAVEPSVVQTAGITSFGAYLEEGGGFNYIFANLSEYEGFTWERGGFLFEKINGPYSKGELKIVNVNASDNPNITFNYYSDPRDLERCVEAIEIMIKTFNTKAFSPYRITNFTDQDILDLNMRFPYNNREHANTSTSLEDQCIGTARSMWHYHGGCHIGQVIDDDYKVIGVKSLRVVDGSTVLNSPGTNPQASIMMLGRYMGVTILSQRIASEAKPYADS